MKPGYFRQYSLDGMASIFRTGAFHMVRLVSYKTQNIDEWDAQPRAWHGIMGQKIVYSLAMMVL